MEIHPLGFFGSAVMTLCRSSWAFWTFVMSVSVVIGSEFRSVK